MPITGDIDVWTITYARPKGTDACTALEFVLDAVGTWAARWTDPESAVKILGSDIRKEIAANMLLESCLLITRNYILGAAEGHQP